MVLTSLSLVSEKLRASERYREESHNAKIYDGNDLLHKRTNGNFIHSVLLSVDLQFYFQRSFPGKSREVLY